MKKESISPQPLTGKKSNRGTNFRSCVENPRRPAIAMKAVAARAAKHGKPMTAQTDQWEAPQKILEILAHPVDPEFFGGGTLARWAQAGHQITYHLLTCGDKGFNPATHPEMTPEKLCGLRHIEQHNAAKLIGASAVHIMNRPDGYLIPDLYLRREIVREIRRHKPDILVTCDPQNLFALYGINHPDHRACGQVV